jgi:pimeloyl-ACP methyl ester carboxylesterase
VNYWGNQVAEFAKDHKVVLIESRGHGRSTRNEQPYTYELMASDVIAVMDKLGIPRASIVGWSDGGIIGLVIAMRHPDRLDRLFAFGANTTPAGLKPKIDENPTFARFIKQAGEQYAALSTTPNEYDLFLAAIGKMWASEPNIPDSALGTIKAKVTIADGEMDEAIRPEHTQEIARAIPGAKLVILPGLSHFAMLQDPAAFNAAVRDFLAAP